MIAKRAVELLISLFLIATATFFLLAAIPGDALSAQTDRLPEEARAQVYKNSGLDKPVLERYAITVNSMLHGEFGESIVTPGETLSGALKEKLPASARLGLQQMIIGIPLGLLLGILAAVYKNTWIDRSVTVISLLLISVPSLVLGFVTTKFFRWQIGAFSDYWLARRFRNVARWLVVYNIANYRRGDELYCSIRPSFKELYVRCFK